MQHETVIVLDFGGQYNQLIARRVRENNVYCEIYSYKTDLSVIKAKTLRGIIFTGGPQTASIWRIRPPSTPRSSAGACLCWASATAASS